MKNSKIMFFVMCISLSLLIGCGGGGGGGGGGGSSIANPTAADPSDPTVTPTPVGNSTVSTTITLPSGLNTSLRAVTTSKYATAKLYVDDVLFQTIAKDFSGNSVTISFTGVKDSGTARLEVELTGCSIHGVTKFSKTGSISANLTLTVDPVIPTGALVTADNRILTEIGTPNNLGWVVGNPMLTFNDLGQPIVIGMDGQVTNLITNQKLFDINKIADLDGSFNDIAWHDGGVVIGGGERVYKVDNSGNPYVWMGIKDNHTPTANGATVSNATFAVIRDMQSIGGNIYFSCNFNQIVKLTGTTLSSVTMSNSHDGLSVTEDGEILLLNYNIPNVIPRTGDPKVGKLIGTSDEEMPFGVGESYSVIKYQDGYLVGYVDEIKFVKNGTSTTWFSKTSLAHLHDAGRLRVYKNHLGEVFVMSELSRKIWKLN